MIRYTKQALVSLEDIFEKIYTDKPGSAQEFMAKMRESIEHLSVMPYLGKECKHKNIDGDCRVYIFQAKLSHRLSNNARLYTCSRYHQH